MRQIDWYYDVISPFAYLASEKLDCFPSDVQITAKPILLAGLLKEYTTKGAGEIAPKRKFVYRQIQWLADRDDVTIQFPPIHPFNPLKLLRLATALNGNIDVAKRLLQFVWREGKSADNEADWLHLLNDLDLQPEQAQQMIQDVNVKEQLFQNTEQAISKGLFGVPSFVINEEIFWGYDTMDFANNYLSNPELFASKGMVNADNVGAGVVRI